MATQNATWPNGDNMIWGNGDNAVWDLSGFFSGWSVALRDYKGLICGLSAALRDYHATLCGKSTLQRTSFKEELFDIYATEETLQVETYLGQTDGTLVDVALADGLWAIEARPYGNQWNATRCGQYLYITVSGGVIDSVVFLPPVKNLYANDRTVFGTDIYWTWSDGYGITVPATFGLWFDASSSIDTSGTPDASVVARVAETLTGYRRTQTVQEYVAVRAMDALGNKGPQSELLLPIPSGSPTSPAYEWGENEL